MGPILYSWFSSPVWTLLQAAPASELRITPLQTVSAKPHLTSLFLNTRVAGHEYGIKRIYQRPGSNYKRQGTQSPKANASAKQVLKREDLAC